MKGSAASRFPKSFLANMGTAAKLRNYRIRAGKTRDEVAEDLGLNAAWVQDLERRDDELASTLTLFQAMQLASILGVSVYDLIGDGTRPDKHIALTDLPARINAHVKRHGLSIGRFGDELDCDLNDLMASPLTVAAEHPIRFLQAISARLGIDWRSLIPDDAAH